MMSEKPAESANQDIKNCQLEHAFQGDLQRRNLDTFHRLIDRSGRSGPAFTVFLVDAKLEKRVRQSLPPDF